MMTRSNKNKQIMSLVLCLTLVLSYVPMTVFAAGEADNGLCEHHTVHTAECGYAEATAGSPCTHEHSEDCYTLVTSCVYTHTVTETDSHECSVESGCVTAVLNCKHTHDDTCGYAEATEGSPCTYVCEICTAETQDDTGPQEIAESNENTESQNNAELQIVTAQSEIQNIVPTTDLPDNDELFAGYVDKAFYGDRSISTFSVSARARLNDEGKELYDFLKTKIESVAKGELESTNFVLDSTSLDAQFEFTNKELGLDTLVETNAETGSLSITGEAKSAALNAFWNQFEISKVFDALLHDCPYDLYWFDKVTGSAFGSSLSARSSDGSTYDTMIIRNPFIRFYVAGPYQADGYSNNSPSVNTTKTGATSAAVENAQAIVTKYKSKFDYEKLIAYRDEICELVTYDDAAAESGNFSENINPWQLIYVFDQDSSTNVVCEGYSKAFQYLCDLTAFNSDVYCYTISGTMSGGTGEGGHMWNIVTMEDGKNYLVDVTNSDDGSIGQNGGLFLSGTATGSISSGYTFKLSRNIKFVYDDDMKELWGTDSDSILNLASSDYTVSTTAAAASVTFADSTTVKYATLAKAVTAVNNSTSAETTVKLLTEAELSDTLEITSGTFTLDLNGKAISNANGTAVKVSGGNVTIKDSGESGIISGSYGVYVAGGTVNIEGGKISGSNSDFYICKDQYINIGCDLGTASYSVDMETSGVFAKPINNVTLKEEWFTSVKEGYVVKKNTDGALSLGEISQVSVNIAWGDMDFTYSDGNWNADTHTYNGGGWTANNNSNYVTIANSGNVEIDVTVAYQTTRTDIKGSITTDGTNAAAFPAALPTDGSKQFYLVLSERPNQELNKAEIGTVTVTIGGNE